MELDLGTMCILGLGLLLMMMILPRLMGGGVQRGPYRPQYDDPDVNSGTGFGGSGQGVRPEYDDPDVGSRSGFGRAFGSFRRRSGGSPFSAGSRGSSEPTRPGGGFDSPDVGSRSGFGRRKK